MRNLEKTAQSIDSGSDLHLKKQEYVDAFESRQQATDDMIKHLYVLRMKVVIDLDSNARTAVGLINGIAALLNILLSKNLKRIEELDAPILMYQPPKALGRKRRLRFPLFKSTKAQKPIPEPSSPVIEPPPPYYESTKEEIEGKANGVSIKTYESWMDPPSDAPPQYAPIYDGPPVTDQQLLISSKK